MCISMVEWLSNKKVSSWYLVKSSKFINYAYSEKEEHTIGTKEIDFGDDQIEEIRF